MTTSTGGEAELKDKDAFEEDWQEVKEYWKRYHSIFDMSYLAYRSIPANYSAYGESYTRAFGLNVFVPRTFQTIQALAAPINSVKTQFVVRGSSPMTKEKAPLLQHMDNAEWKRSKADNAKCEAHVNALIFGQGYLFNEFVWDRRRRHFPITPVKPPEAANDGTESDEDEAEKAPDPKKTEWEERYITYYKGMRPRSLNPYYVFPDKASTCDEDERFKYLYTPIPVDTARNWAVAQGWVSEAEAAELITEQRIEYFDGVREMIDSFYSIGTEGWSRGDHITPQIQRPTVEKDTRNMTAFIERFEEDYYEVRVVGSDKPLFKDYNVYPHKQIPILTVYDVKIPGERRGIGEPEIIRYQQLEENKLHNMLLQTILMTMVQRYAIRKDLFENEGDLFFNNPFKPLVLKPIPGVSINQGFMPLPQPEVKRSPFELIEMVKNISQQATGATDFIVSGSTAETETATESNNLLAASNARIRDKVRQMDETMLSRLIEQWHACYTTMYDEDMDMLINGEDTFFMYLPYDRAVANENEAMIKEASKKLNAVGDTLEMVYLNAGYKFTVFASDLLGRFIVDVIISDVALESTKKFNEFMNAVRTMAEVNKLAAQGGEQQRFDVMKLAREALKNLDFIKDIDEYMLNAPQSGIMPEDKLAALGEDQVETRSGAVASEESGVEVGGPQPAGV